MDFDWNRFIDAMGLVFIIEGIMPFILPDVFRRYLQTMNLQNNNVLRIVGFVSMIIGLILLFAMRIF